MVNTSPYFSLIMPIYNVERFLDRAIQSVLDQTFRDFELILIDDGSPDASGEIADYYAALDSRLRVFHNKNCGLSGARNAGLRVARGKVVGFIDSDDYVHRELLQNIYSEFVDGADLVMFGYVREEQEGNRLVLLPEVQVEQAKIMLATDEIQSFAWNKYIRKDLLPCEFFPLGRNFEDYYVFPSLFWSFKKIKVLPKCLYFYNCQNQSSITKQMHSLSYFQLFEAFSKNERLLRENSSNQSAIDLISSKTLSICIKSYCIHTIDGKLSAVHVATLREYLKYRLLNTRLGNLKTLVFVILAILRCDFIIRLYAIRNSLNERFKSY